MRTPSSGLASLTLLFLAAGPAFAHEGHGNPEWARSVLHYLLEPEHLAATLPAAVAVLLIGKWVSNRLLQRTALTRRR